MRALNLPKTGSTAAEEIFDIGWHLGMSGVSVGDICRIRRRADQHRLESMCDTHARQNIEINYRCGVASRSHRRHSSMVPVIGARID